MLGKKYDSYVLLHHKTTKHLHCLQDMELLERGESDGLALLVEGENMLILDSTSAVVGGA